MSSLAPLRPISCRVGPLSTHTPMRARRDSSARRAIFCAPTTSLLTRTSVIPPSTIASASDTFWQHRPTAPSAIWRLPTCGHLWVLACGRMRRRPPTAFFSVRRFFSNASRSSTSAGVSTSSSRCPMLAGARI
jgi:hypothetical protein